jgi:hypothetical protein
VEVDARRVAQVFAGACLVALGVVAVVLFVAGANKNAQITRLRDQGVAVKVTVSGCTGEMGGSGTNLVGYDCTGSFRIGGRRYNEDLPGTSFRQPGTTLQAITVPGDPALLTTPRVIAGEHPSFRVFILPTVLLIVLVLVVAALVLKRRRGAGGDVQLDDRLGAAAGGV